MLLSQASTCSDLVQTTSRAIDFNTSRVLKINLRRPKILTGNLLIFYFCFLLFGNNGKAVVTFMRIKGLMNFHFFAQSF